VVTFAGDGNAAGTFSSGITAAVSCATVVSGGSGCWSPTFILFGDPAGYETHAD